MVCYVEMSEGRPIEFLILGPLEFRVEGRSVPLGGAKQRAVLASLLLNSSKLVPVERLVDEVWGDNPPASAAHTIEGYVSRLRRIIEPHGPTLSRRGNGYRLDATPAVLDAHTAARLVDEALREDETGKHRRASELAQRALDLWRGPVLADAPLRATGAVEVEQLEDLRLRALEHRTDADLALGRHEEAVGALTAAIDQHPYRERLVAQLMVALYRSGRQAESLEAYEQFRRALADDLGLRPSADLQGLSGEIVRQEPRLAAPARRTAATSRPRARRTWVAAAGLGLAGAVAAVTVSLVGASGGGDRAADSPPRAALVVPWSAEAGRGDTLAAQLVNGLRRAARDYGVEAQTLVARPSASERMTPSARRTAARLRSGNFDLAILTAETGLLLSATVRELASTRFVLLDNSIAQAVHEQGALPNATGVLFAGDQAGYLVGYLSGLMEARRAPRLNGARILSAIGGIAGVSAVTDLIEGFRRGARRALPGVTVLIGYSGDFEDPSKCEAIANRHIDAGADIVFAAAGTCSFGALSAAGIRGVWGIGVDADRSYLGDHILASAVKRYDQALMFAVRSHARGALPAGRDVLLGVDEDAVAIAGISPEVPEPVRRKLARVAAGLRKGTEP